MRSKFRGVLGAVMSLALSITGGGVAVVNSPVAGAAEEVNTYKAKDYDWSDGYQVGKALNEKNPGNIAGLVSPAVQVQRIGDEHDGVQEWKVSWNNSPVLYWEPGVHAYPRSPWLTFALSKNLKITSDIKWEMDSRAPWDAQIEYTNPEKATPIHAEKTVKPNYQDSTGGWFMDLKDPRYLTSSNPTRASLKYLRNGSNVWCLRDSTNTNNVEPCNATVLEADNIRDGQKTGPFPWLGWIPNSGWKTSEDVSAVFDNGGYVSAVQLLWDPGWDDIGRATTVSATFKTTRTTAPGEINVVDESLKDQPNTWVLGGYKSWYGGNPYVQAIHYQYLEKAKDSDEDGLSDVKEAEAGTNPSDTDSDDDGILDGWEFYHTGTDPLDKDTDDDGFNDGAELGYNGVNGCTDNANSYTDEIYTKFCYGDPAYKNTQDPATLTVKTAGTLADGDTITGIVKGNPREPGTGGVAAKSVSLFATYVDGDNRTFLGGVVSNPDGTYSIEVGKTLQKYDTANPEAINPVTNTTYASDSDGVPVYSDIENDLNITNLDPSKIVIDAYADNWDKRLYGAGNASNPRNAIFTTTIGEYQSNDYEVSSWLNDFQFKSTGTDASNRVDSGYLLKNGFFDENPQKEWTFTVRKTSDGKGVDDNTSVWVDYQGLNERLELKTATPEGRRGPAGWVEIPGGVEIPAWSDLPASTENSQDHSREFTINVYKYADAAVPMATRTFRVNPPAAASQVTAWAQPASGYTAGTAVNTGEVTATVADTNGNVVADGTPVKVKVEVKQEGGTYTETVTDAQVQNGVVSIPGFTPAVAADDAVKITILNTDDPAAALTAGTGVTNPLVLAAKAPAPTYAAAQSTITFEKDGSVVTEVAKGDSVNVVYTPKDSAGDALTAPIDDTNKVKLNVGGTTVELTWNDAKKAYVSQPQTQDTVGTVTANGVADTSTAGVPAATLTVKEQATTPSTQQLPAPTAVTAVKGTDSKTTISATIPATVPAGTPVTVKNGLGEVIATGTVKNGGIVDSSGNPIKVSDLNAGDTVAVTVGSGTATSKPTFGTVTSVPDQGKTATPSVTNAVLDGTGKVTVTGSVPGARVNTTVTVKLPDGTSLVGTTDAEGTFTVTGTPKTSVKAGDVVSVIAQTPGKSVSDSVTKPLTATQVQPAQKSTTPVDVQVVANSDGTATVSGSVPNALANTTVTVTLPDGTSVTGPVDANGLFNFTVTPKQPLKPGASVTISATEPGKAKSDPASATVKYPAPTEVAAVKDAAGNTTISGKSTAADGTPVTVTLPDGTTVSGKVQGGNIVGTDGKSLVVPGLSDDDKVSVTVGEGAATSPAGEATVGTKEATPTDLTATYDPATGNTTISGDSPAKDGTPVTVTVPGKDPIKGQVKGGEIVGEDGNPIVIPDLQPGAAVSVTVGEGDSTSDPAATTVKYPAPTEVAAVKDAAGNTTISGKSPAADGTPVTVTVPGKDPIKGQVKGGKIVGEDGNPIVVPGLKDGDKVSVTVGEGAATSPAAEATVVTKQPTPTDVTAVQTGPGEVTVTGDSGAADGTPVTVKDADGKVVGTGTVEGGKIVGEDGKPLVVSGVEPGETVKVTVGEGDSASEAAEATVKHAAPTEVVAVKDAAGNTTISGNSPAKDGTPVTVTLPDGNTVSGKVQDGKIVGTDGNPLVVPGLKDGDKVSVTVGEGAATSPAAEATVVTKQPTPTDVTAVQTGPDEVTVTGDSGAADGTPVTVKDAEGKVVGTGTVEGGKIKAEDGKPLVVTGLTPGEKVTVTVGEGANASDAAEVTVVGIPVVDSAVKDPETGEVTITGSVPGAPAGTKVDVVNPTTGETVATGTTDDDGKFVVVVEPDKAANLTGIQIRAGEGQSGTTTNSSSVVKITDKESTVNPPAKDNNVFKCVATSASIPGKILGAILGIGLTVGILAWAKDNVVLPDAVGAVMRSVPGLQDLQNMLPKLPPMPGMPDLSFLVPLGIGIGLLGLLAGSYSSCQNAE